MCRWPHHRSLSRFGPPIFFDLAGSVSVTTSAGVRSTSTNTRTRYVPPANAIRDCSGGSGGVFGRGQHAAHHLLTDVTAPDFKGGAVRDLIVVDRLGDSCCHRGAANRRKSGPHSCSALIRTWSALVRPSAAGMTSDGRLPSAAATVIGFARAPAAPRRRRRGTRAPGRGGRQRDQMGLDPGRRGTAGAGGWTDEQGSTSFVPSPLSQRNLHRAYDDQDRRDSEIQAQHRQPRALCERQPRSWKQP